MLDDGRVRARVRPWPLETEVAQLVLTDHTKGPAVTTIEDWMRVLATAGFRSVRTGALSESAVEPFLELGFRSIQTLALLELAHIDHHQFRAPHHDVRPVRTHRQLAMAAEIDSEAFENGWGLDTVAIVDACHATPHHRIRLAYTATEEPAGYMITGRNGTAGFVQRLAVLERFEGQGIATSLLIDGLTWLGRRGVDKVLVNTNFDNQRAIDVYERFGFVIQPSSLRVLERSLDHVVPARGTTDGAE